ncbi:hypothetical protein H5410_030736 [Solanum commersonii]|uniref:Polyprotein protein n=1 Tax=Solanum commersonii TaxID=4109 RepID=A0A9J5YK85_SOLCO|nr:hypothetical protein H5410_030736 [Solanum commersonii]
MVRGKKVECHSKHINVELGRPLHLLLPYHGLYISPSLDDLNGWLAPMISDTTMKWMDARFVRETRLERSIPGIIGSAILTALNTLRTTIDNLTARVSTCESRQGETPKVSPLKAEMAEFKKVVAYFKATNFTTLMRGGDDKNAPETLGIPSATTGNVQRDDAGYAELETETDEEQVAMRDEVVSESQEGSIFRDLPNLMEMVVQSVTQIVSVEMSTAAPRKHGHYFTKRNKKVEKNEENEGLRIAESTWRVAEGYHFAFCSSVLSTEGKDQVGGKKKQSAHRRDVSRGNTMSPNDPEHDDA